MDQSCSPHPPGRMPWAGGALAVTILVAACAAPEPNVAVSPRASVSEAQRILLLAAANGPVPLVVDAAPSALGGPDLNRIATLAEDGVADYTRVDFAPESGTAGPRSDVRLALRFRRLETVEPARICSGQPVPEAAPSSPPRLQAVLCDGERYIGDAVGIARSDAGSDVSRLVTQTVSALFPPTAGYGGGYNLPGVSIFGGIGGHGSGVGVGLGF